MKLIFPMFKSKFSTEVDLTNMHNIERIIDSTSQEYDTPLEGLFEKNMRHRQNIRTIVLGRRGAISIPGNAKSIIVIVKEEVANEIKKCYRTYPKPYVFNLINSQGAVQDNGPFDGFCKQITVRAIAEYIVSL